MHACMHAMCLYVYVQTPYHDHVRKTLFVASAEVVKAFNLGSAPRGSRFWVWGIRMK